MPVCVENADDIAKGSVIGGGGGFGFVGGLLLFNNGVLGHEGRREERRVQLDARRDRGPRVAEFRSPFMLDLEGALSRFHGLLERLQALGELDRRHCAIARSWPRRDPDA